MSGYGGQHQAIRRALLPTAVGQICCRCGRPITAGQAVDLDHTDDRAGYRGLAHSRCNRSAGGRLGAARKQELRSERKRTMIEAEQVLGIEIAEDRGHTSIAAAAALPADMVVIELAAYLDGTDAVAQVLDLRTARTVLAVVIDPHSPAATLIKPLTDAGIEVTQASTSDVAVAHGSFLDLIAAGRLRHTGQAQLDAAVRHGTQRPVGGATMWERRNDPVDVAPLRAATLAVWGLLARPPVQPFFAAWR